jgi:hypothetical protein
MNCRRALPLTVTLLSLAVAAPAPAAGPFRYPEGKYGKGELRYINGLPVLLVRGSPRAVGEQVGALALKPARPLVQHVEGFVKAQGWERVYPLMLKTGGLLVRQFPPDHVTELEAAARSSGWSRDLLVFANTVADLRVLGGCSVLMVEPGRSTTGGPLFGRNLDWPPFGPLPEYTLVVVCRPAGKRAFASVTYPGMIGCVSGMNDAGLALADLTVTSAADGSPRLDLAGTPYTLALRRVLEECATVAEAEKLLRSLKRTTRQNIAVCDKKRAAVFEVTPRSLVVRPAVEGVCACTNHFRTKELATSKVCRRYDVLEKSRELKRLGVADVARQMDAVNQGQATLQTMVFEPAALRLRLAFGRGPATRLPLRTLELAELLGATRTAEGKTR